MSPREHFVLNKNENQTFDLKTNASKKMMETQTHGFDLNIETKVIKSSELDNQYQTMDKT